VSGATDAALGDTAPQQANVCAVVVTFHPDAEVASHLERVAAQVGAVVVVDNSGDGAAAAMLRAAMDRLAHGRSAATHLILNRANLGIAPALNLGVRWAADQGYRWALTMDQDSVASPDLVAGLAAVYRDCGYGDRVGAIGANWVNASTGTENDRASVFEGRAWRECTVVITSGTLVSLAAYSVVGPFRDAFFIDSVDHEFCLRLRSRGYRVLAAREALLVHPLGGYRRLQVLGLGIAHSDHPPIRKYYQIRNRLALIREYGLREPQFALRLARRVVQDAVLMLVVERSRLRKAAATALGAWHFLEGRSGALEVGRHPFIAGGDCAPRTAARSPSNSGAGRGGATAE
jgi:rhamnosyltransferase